MAARFSAAAKTLKPKCVLVAVTFLALTSMNPASAPPREIEDFCFKQAQQATLPHRNPSYRDIAA